MIMDDFELDLSKATLICPKEMEAVALKAVSVFVDEVKKRTRLTLPVSHEEPSKQGEAYIVVGTQTNLPLSEDLYAELQPHISRLKQEGYVLKVNSQQSPIQVVICGADSRGLLYGIGKFLRQAYFNQNELKIASHLDMTSSPHAKIRGHQLGYRPKTNAYDAWSIEQFEQYIREVALFGSNTIEIVPPRTDDDATGSLMKMDPLEMMIQLSRIIDSYGLDVWIWYPNMGVDYDDPSTRQLELAERENIFRKLPRIDVVMIPGSDPGGMEPEPLFDWAEEVSQLLTRYHPQAEVWLAPQVMNYESKIWLKRFYALLDREPDWVGGVVYGPHVDEMLPIFREKIPAKYPICRYEDITHNYHCQYPVAEWDIAFALTIGREGYNPRPRDHKHIHNVFDRYAIGNISYSEGINDDVNKFIWNDQDWDPATDVVDTLREYARLFIHSDYDEAIAQGIMALETNWKGPLLINEQVDITLLQWRQMEKEVPSEVSNNYRFQMGLIRAYYDAYTRRRLIYETELEQKAKEALRFASLKGSLSAISEAEAYLARAQSEPVAPDYKQRCVELADQLFEKIGYQLTVARHQAISVDRGAFMDTIDTSLNDQIWILAQCDQIKKMDSEAERLAAIERFLNRNNPGLGGRYSDLGSYVQNCIVDEALGFERDPGYLQSPRFAPAFYLLDYARNETKQAEAVPLSTVRHLNTMNDVSIRITFTDLNPNLQYSVKVAYLGDVENKKNPRDYLVRLTVNDTFVVQDQVKVKDGGVTIKQSDIPQQAVQDGQITLTFQRISGFKRLNIAEVWLSTSKKR